MWVIIKYKIKEYNILKNHLIEKMGEKVQFYIPKIKYKRLKKNKFETHEKTIIEDYMFCYHDKFNDKKYISQIKNIRGLKYLLENSILNQKELNSFILRCKKHEVDGYLTQEFFNILNNQKAVFISGPFTNMIFKIINQQRKKIKILLGDLKVTVSKKDYLFRPL